MTAYYNEIDPDAAALLRALIDADQIAPGIVDERSIEDVRPDELTGYAQCHFFAGLGIWSLALRNAGIQDDFPIWTGSCPCQPFSAAGKGDGFEDDRHLWPTFFHLISQCRPIQILGEQVASKDTGPWVDLVQDNVESLGYTFGAVPFAAACVGAPHIRDRLYWVANANGELRDWAGNRGTGWWPEHSNRCAVGGLEYAGSNHDASQSNATSAWQPQTNGPANKPCGSGVSSGILGNAGNAGSAGLAQCVSDTGISCWEIGGIAWQAAERTGIYACGMADNLMQQRQDGQPRVCAEHAAQGRDESSTEIAGFCSDSRTSPTNSYWADADWLRCRDDKWRPVEPGTQPLAAGMPRSMGDLSPEIRRLAELAGLSPASLKRAKSYRVSGLRGYGNAINAKAAQAFIECVMEAV